MCYNWGLIKANEQKWIIKRPKLIILCYTDKRPNKVKCVKCSSRPCVATERTTEGSGWCTNEVSRKWLILTYCCRNVSVGRVIGIHIGRVMGGREHSVVVDSESWTKTTEKNSDSHLYRHMTEDTREQWEEDNGRNVVRRYETEWCRVHSGSALFPLTWGLSLTQSDSTHHT